MRRIEYGAALAAIIIAGWAMPLKAQQKPAPKAATTKTETVSPDLTVLDAFRDALLDLKGAVQVGVNRADYQRKLQTATGESLKAEDRLPDKPGIATHCFALYKIALLYYQSSIDRWDNLLWWKEHLPDSESETNAEEGLQKSWSDADSALEEARSCTKPKTK